MSYEQQLKNAHYLYKYKEAAQRSTNSADKEYYNYQAEKEYLHQILNNKEN